MPIKHALMARIWTRSVPYLAFLRRIRIWDSRGSTLNKNGQQLANKCWDEVRRTKTWKNEKTRNEKTKHYQKMIKNVEIRNTRVSIELWEIEERSEKNKEVPDSGVKQATPWRKVNNAYSVYFIFSIYSIYMCIYANTLNDKKWALADTKYLEDFFQIWSGPCVKFWHTCQRFTNLPNVDEFLKIWKFDKFWQILTNLWNVDKCVRSWQTCRILTNSSKLWLFFKLWKICQKMTTFQINRNLTSLSTSSLK